MYIELLSSYSQAKEQMIEKPKLSKDRANLIKQCHEVTSLYSEYIYRTTPKQSLYSSEVQKYKLLYSTEKKEHNKLKITQRLWEEQRNKLLEQHKIFSFAIDTMMMKISSSQSGKQNYIKTVSNNLETENMVVSPLDQVNSNKQNHKKNKKQRSNLSKTQYKPKNIEQNKDKLKILDFLKSRFNETEGEVNNCSLMDLAHMKTGLTYDISLKIQQQKEIKGLKQKNLEWQRKIIQLQAKTSEHQNLIDNLNQSLKEINKKFSDQSQQLINQKKISQCLSKDLNISLKISDDLRNNINRLQKNLKFLETKMKVTEQEYRDRQQKEKACVIVLQKFTRELQINDQKIIDFLNNQVGLQQTTSNLNRTRKTYQEYISYIIHLCRKKDDIYNDMVNEFKEQIFENDLQMKLIQKRAVTLKNTHQKIMCYINNIKEFDVNSDIKLRELINFVKRA